jgi:hypothetical protein
MRTNDVIGLIPCGGHATRIAPLPCSKEVLPLGLRVVVQNIPPGAIAMGAPARVLRMRSEFA